jgi:hypothetical protein
MKKVDEQMLMEALAKCIVLTATTKVNSFIKEMM